MYDALIPAAQAMDQHRGLPLPEVMAYAVQAAKDGSERTKEMLAKKGRARFLAERSLDHMDAGAYSFYLWMKEWENQLKGKD